MSSRPNEVTVEEVTSDLKELLFISKFIKNKKEIKKERKIIKEMIKDFENDKYEKYISEEVDNYD